MRNIILLSVVTTSFIFGANVVNDLTVDQKNEINNNSNFSNGATVSQGQTDIQNNSNVDSVNILQRDGTDAGNLIENTDVTNQSGLYQGYTYIENSKLHNTDLESKNHVKNVTVTDGSLVGQSILLIGGDSNVSGTAGSGGGGMGMGGSGENLKITQTNLLQDTNIKNSFVVQGLTYIDNGADVSNTFKLEQTNTINRASASGTNDINASELTQGVTNISGGTTTNIEQTIENVMEDITVDRSHISQSTIKLNNSDVSNINNGASSSIDDKNRVSYVTARNNSNIDQSTIDIDTSSVNGLYRDDRGVLEENNWIHTVTVDNSDIRQSNFSATNSSDVLNVTYTTHESGINATNLVYNSTATNNSKFNQDVTELNHGVLTNTTLNRANTLNTVTADNSKLKQFNVQVTNSTLENSDLSQQGLMYNLNTTNANLSQGSTVITD